MPEVLFLRFSLEMTNATRVNITFLQMVFTAHLLVSLLEMPLQVERGSKFFVAKAAPRISGEEPPLSFAELAFDFFGEWHQWLYFIIVGVCFLDIRNLRLRIQILKVFLFNLELFKLFIVLSGPKHLDVGILILP